MERFTDHQHTIYLGDVIEVLSTDSIPDGSVSLIFADPPYNIGKNFHGRKDEWPTEEAYLHWVETWLNLCLRKLTPNGSLYLMCSTQCFAPIDLLLRRQLTILSRIIWQYDSSGVQAKRYYGSLWEPIFHCVKNRKDYVFNSNDILVEAKTGATRKLIDYRKQVPSQYNTQKVPGNVWNIARVRYRMQEYEEHPTQKPLALLERIILASSNKGDLILDPFGGTFSTSYAAKLHGRRSVSLDISEDYLKIGLRRLGIRDAYKGQPLHRPLKTYQSGYSLEAQSMTLFEK